MKTQGMESNGDFDVQSVITNLPVSKLAEVSFMDMLNILSPLVLVQIPENVFDDKKKLDYLLARMANLYAYLRVLWSAASYERAKLRHVSGTDDAETMLKKKEALFELGNAVKLKYEAVSRKITVALSDEEETPERADYVGRRERVVNTPPEKRKSSWDHLK